MPSPFPPEAVFAVWLAVGLVALLVGAVAVRLSIRRLARISTPVAEPSSAFVAASAPSAPLRAAA